MFKFVTKSVLVCTTLALFAGSNCGESRADYYRNYGKPQEEMQGPNCNCQNQLPADQQEFMEKLGPLHASIYLRAFNNDLRQETIALYRMSSTRLTPNQAVERVIEAYRDESNNREQAMPQRKQRRRQQYNY